MIYVFCVLRHVIILCQVLPVSHSLLSYLLVWHLTVTFYPCLSCMHSLLSSSHLGESTYLVLLIYELVFVLPLFWDSIWENQHNLSLCNISMMYLVGHFNPSEYLCCVHCVSNDISNTFVIPLQDINCTYLNTWPHSIRKKHISFSSLKKMFYSPRNMYW